MILQVGSSLGVACNLGYHVVWCPKYRRSVLGGRIRNRLGESIRAQADGRGWEIVVREAMPDRVHLFIEPRPKASLSYMADRFKGFTFHYLRAGFPHLRSQLPTLWSQSYAMATVGAVFAEAVHRYIDTRYERVPTGGGARA
ncbi:IS200/IS605 family transposase [Streptosporangium longisporum]|uniref:IS200/IS605 family transposase n=1 Tax=Streptosporangium longisporum TaxID=46187 RepID=A0ABP6L380_9ACTN